MLQLLIDTSNKDLAVGIADENHVIAKIQYEAWQKQSELTIQEIDKLFKQNNINPKSINRIVVSNGPGSYTGIRIGLTIAKIYATTLHIPLCLISSLQMLSSAKGNKIALMDARSKRAYVGVYQDGEALIDDTVLPLTEIEKMFEQYPSFTLVGDTQLFHVESSKEDLIENLFELAKVTKDIENPHLALPVYLKD